MENLYEKPATSALNEDTYINKIYGSTLDSQKKALQQGYDSSVKQLQHRHGSGLHIRYHGGLQGW